MSRLFHKCYVRSAGANKSLSLPDLSFPYHIICRRACKCDKAWSFAWICHKNKTSSQNMGGFQNREGKVHVCASCSEASGCSTGLNSGDTRWPILYITQTSQTFYLSYVFYNILKKEKIGLYNFLFGSKLILIKIVCNSSLCSAR